MVCVYIFLIIAISLQAIDWLFHRADLSNMSLPNDISLREIKAKLVRLSSSRFDNIVGLLPFIWTYLYIISTIIVFNKFSSIPIRILLILFVTGRYRSLQEIGHHAIHTALCPNVKWGMFLTNVFYQFPLWMPEASIRRDIHVRQHHHSVNMPHDPDLKELQDKNLKPGISQFQFWVGVFYPLTFTGIKTRIKECIDNTIANGYGIYFYARLACVSIIIGIFLAFHQINALLFLYFFPVIVTYPLFYWIAHITLHRWYAPNVIGMTYDEHELMVGRPTEFKGILGLIVRYNIFPFGDSYHLAHSLFPTVRWNYLSQIDKLLKKTYPHYSDHVSCNLFWQTRNMPSAISELKERLVNKPGVICQA